MKKDFLKPLLITTSALVLSLCFDVLFYHKIPGISFPIFTVLMLIATLILMRWFMTKLDAEAMALMITVLVLSSFVFVRSSSVLVAFDITLSLYLFALLLGRITGLSIRDFVVARYVRQLFGASLQSLVEGFRTLKDLVYLKDEFRGNTTLRQVARGTAITLPALAVFALLLSSADLVFHKYLADIARFFERLNFMEHTLLLGVAFILITGMFGYAFYRHGEQQQGEDLEVALAGKLLDLGFIRGVLVLGVVSFFALIGSYIFLESTFAYIESQLIEMPFSLHAEYSLLPPTIITLVFGYIFYRYRLQPAVDPDSEHTQVVAVASRLRSISFVESSILLGSINALFLVFIALQFTYLFGGNHTISAQGFTYAEYAHRGFFELVAVALLSFLIIWQTDAKTKTAGKRHSLQFKALTGALIGQVVIIMVSAFKRLLIYEAAYGYTVLRVYTQVFIVMLGIIFLLFLIKILVHRNEAWFSLRAFAIAVAFLIGLNIINTDQVIAHLNIARYKVTHNKDLLIYNSSLSEDAIDQMVAAYYLLRDDKREGWINDDLKQRLASVEDVPWQSYSVSRAHAHQSLHIWEEDYYGKNKKD
ncbi:MAG: DUF4153 domain-containing protein [Candidatus Aquicultor sp.]